MSEHGEYCGNDLLMLVDYNIIAQKINRDNIGGRKQISKRYLFIKDYKPGGHHA